MKTESKGPTCFVSTSKVAFQIKSFSALQNLGMLQKVHSPLDRCRDAEMSRKFNIGWLPTV